MDIGFSVVVVEVQVFFWVEFVVGYVVYEVGVVVDFLVVVYVYVLLINFEVVDVGFLLVVFVKGVEVWQEFVGIFYVLIVGFVVVGVGFDVIVFSVVVGQVFGSGCGEWQGGGECQSNQGSFYGGIFLFLQWCIVCCFGNVNFLLFV